MTTLVTLCRRDELADGAARGFTVDRRGEPFTLFALRRGDRVDVWQNFCPHLGVELNWAPDHFLTHDGAYYLCGTHGALFRLDDGYCVQGPCQGRSLIRIPAAWRDDALEIVLP